MCLAVPMRVEEIKGDPEDFTQDQIARVDMDGVSTTVRLDVVDRWPEVGDYVIVHAGFAIHSLDEAEAKKNIELIRELASHMPPELLMADGS
ncbi:MAG: HypC/HybG/HupF family hydrogenase formation chaperone [Desulfofustis sp. PB-SRB1]|jgi:hydrogenase expression/formation protein HypC|nr:HypC/HybG/HupF family hydrogenase formation chaperone [Desulfofustis sp. PB-SRB1]MBM1001031.1 HypC/HybG/HupF family hydrogenase formation chaperone [Desulfofustis sp. PB-SRB1]HBH27686.1 hydrogenase assembly protein HupF [Desulfofustis sp.]HBH30728.1 hydrogenase assembly protein HupF [Desulfofustis sp.]